MRKAWYNGHIINITEEEYIHHCTRVGSALRQATLDQLEVKESKKGLAHNDPVKYELALHLGFPKYLKYLHPGQTISADGEKVK